ncbi:MAG: class I SAM-dependent methyltransferase [Pirellulales bacterium]|nr:class I SAM-dependent methyltransferase [Pirellulales bacterium]
MPTGQVVCPLCHAAGSAVQWAEVHGLAVWDCKECSHRFAVAPCPAEHVAAIYDDAYFFGGGAGYADYLQSAAVLRRRGAYYARCMARHAKSGRILDVGAAAGYTLQAFVEAGWTGFGVEPNATMAAHARRESGVESLYGRLQEIPAGVEFDLVAMLQIVAHFADLQAEIRRAAAAVAPSGFLLVETWNHASFLARMQGRHWHEYNPPSVLHWFTPASLDRLMDSVDFEPIDGGRPRRQITGAHAKSLLAHVGRSSLLFRGAALGCRVIPDAWAIPYPSWDLFWRLYRRRQTQPYASTPAFDRTADNAG